jgi:hypothetical protein
MDGGPFDEGGRGGGVTRWRPFAQTDRERKQQRKNAAGAATVL